MCSSACSATSAHLIHCPACLGLSGVAAPGLRNETHDWSLEGRRMRGDDIQYVASKVAAFKAGIPRYPADVFQVSAR